MRHAGLLDFSPGGMCKTFQEPSRQVKPLLVTGHPALMLNLQFYMPHYLREILWSTEATKLADIKEAGKAAKFVISIIKIPLQWQRSLWAVPPSSSCLNPDLQKFEFCSSKDLRLVLMSFWELRFGFSKSNRFCYSKYNCAYILLKSVLTVLCHNGHRMSFFYTSNGVYGLQPCS